MKSSKSGSKSSSGRTKSASKSGATHAKSGAKAQAKARANGRSTRSILKVVAGVVGGCVAVVGLGYGLFMFGMLPSWVPGVSLASASAASLPSAPVGRELGETVVKASCIGRCHGPKIESYRTSAKGAKRIAEAMAGRTGLTPGQTQSVAIYLTR